MISIEFIQDDKISHPCSLIHNLVLKAVKIIFTMSSKPVCSIHNFEACSLWCPAIMEKYPCDPPHHFFCPITLELMNYPVTDEYGFTFERSALMENLQHRNYLCPTTGERYTWTHLQVNYAVSQTIRHCMLTWWKDWYYHLKPFQTIETPKLKTPKRRMQEASKRYQERLLLENRFNRHSRSNAVDLRTPSEVLAVESSTDSDYVESIEL